MSIVSLANDRASSVLPKPGSALENWLKYPLYMFMKHGNTSVWKERLRYILLTAMNGYVCEVVCVCSDPASLATCVYVTVNMVPAFLYFNQYSHMIKPSIQLIFESSF